jgi:hypothetical protein
MSAANVFLLLLAFASATFAQSTWGGLRFGMTEAEARTTLNGRNIRPTPADEKLESGTLVNPFIVDATFGSTSGYATPAFSKTTKRLVQVNLTFELDSVEHLISQLSVKYGNPIKAYKCDSAAQDFCSATWKTANQGIGLTVMKFKKYMAVISYFRQSSEL